MANNKKQITTDYTDYMEKTKKEFSAVYLCLSVLIPPRRDKFCGYKLKNT